MKAIVVRKYGGTDVLETVDSEPKPGPGAAEALVKIHSAGGPVSGAVALALIVNAESAHELDDLITSLPVWPRMETEVTPLTTFDARRQSLAARLEALRAQTGEIGASTPGASR